MTTDVVSGSKEQRGLALLLCDIIQIRCSKYNTIKLFLEDKKVYTMLLFGLRWQRHSFCLSSKKFSHKKEKSSGRLAIYVFKNLRMRM